MVKSWEWEIDRNTFDIINIDFFVNYRITTLLGYISIFLFLILKIAFLASDIYTAVRLIVFNTWTSEIQPFISYTICRWLFFACIVLSVVLYVYGFIRAILVCRTRNISLTFINKTSQFLYSLMSYRYYCVYNEISSDSFFNYLLFFTYLSFQDSLVLLLCDTPRQVINGITIFKILKFNSSMIAVIRQIATTNRAELIVLSFMTFSFIVWFIFFVKFLFACILFIPIYHKVKYTLHYEHGLKQYCCIKINRCIQNFVKVKHSKSLEQVKKENKRAKVNPRLPSIELDEEEKNSHVLTHEIPILSHQPSEVTLVDRNRLKNLYPSKVNIKAASRQNSNFSQNTRVPGLVPESRYAPGFARSSREIPVTQYDPTSYNYSPPQLLRENDFSSLSINEESSASLDLDIPSVHTEDEDNLITNDVYATRGTMIEDLELPPRVQMYTRDSDFFNGTSRDIELLGYNPHRSSGQLPNIPHIDEFNSYELPTLQRNTSREVELTSHELSHDQGYRNQEQETHFYNYDSRFNYTRDP